MDLRSLAGTTSNTKGALKETHPLFHADEPQPASGGFYRFLNKSLSVVADTDSHACGGAEQTDQHLRGLGMLEYILETFLRHAVEAGRNVHWKGPGYISLRVLDLQTGTATEVIDLISDRCL